MKHGKKVIFKQLLNVLYLHFILVGVIGLLMNTSFEYTLRQSLFVNSFYDKTVRPVMNPLEHIHMNFSLRLAKLNIVVSLRRKCEHLFLVNLIIKHSRGKVFSRTKLDNGKSNLFKR